MKPIWKAWVCQIDITNVCGRGCVYCSRYDRYIRKDQRFNMDLDTFKKAILSLNDFPGRIGIIGGEPVLHPQFKEICFIIQDLYSREERKRIKVWTSAIPMFEKYRGLIETTFLGGIVENAHNKEQIKVCKHQPITVAVGDVVAPGEYRRKLIEDCWVQEKWCPTINHKGAFFCEIAGALDVILDGPGGYEIEPTWWKRTPEQFQDQVDRYCLYCGMPVPMERQLLEDKKEKISEGLFLDFKDHNLNNLEGLEIIKGLFTIEQMEAAREGWFPGNYRGDKGEK